MPAYATFNEFFHLEFRASYLPKNMEVVLFIQEYFVLINVASKFRTGYFYAH